MSSQGRCLLIGNSRWHWATETNSSWHFTHEVVNAKKPFHAIDSPLLAWAAVGEIPKTIILNPSKRIEVKHIPLKKLPPWLGIDRALAGWGALQRRNLMGLNSELLIADAGTVLSLTKFSSDGEFTGGQLVAGLHLQLSAMANGAHNLSNPGIENHDDDDYFPRTTNQAMRQGALQALIGTLCEAHKESQIPLWLCGGDAPLLVNELRKRKLAVSHYPNLVLEGLVDIYQKINRAQGQQ